MSTFHALETARRGMMTQQYALHTTGHNIANANTPGYSRQRVNFTQTEPYPPIGINRPLIPGHMGTGVQAGSIQRVREGFLDVQYRNENNKHGYWSMRNEALEKMEDIMNEPSEQALANTIDQFWMALQDLGAQPEDAGARAVVRQRGNALAETFNYAYNSISTIRQDFKGQIDTTEKQVNSLIRQINSINRIIGETEPHGYVTNDLYDERDNLLDQLSELVNIKIDPVQSGGMPDKVAEGKVTVRLVDNAGNPLDPDIVLINGENPNDVKGLKIEYMTDEMGGQYIQSVGVGPLGNGNTVTETTENITVEAFSNGKLKAAMEAYGYEDENGNIKGIYPEMLADLDEMAYRFATEFNKIHETGWNLNEIAEGKKAEGGGVSFFKDTGNPDHSGLNTGEGKLEFNEAEHKKGFASRIAVSDAIQNSTNNIAAAGAGANINTQMTYTGEAPKPKGSPVVHGIFTGFPQSSEYQAAEKLTIKVSFDNGEWTYQVNDEAVETFNPPMETVFGITIDVTGLKYEDTESFSWEIKDIPLGTKDSAFPGDGSNALLLSNMKDMRFNFGGSSANVQSFYRGVIGDMAVDTSEAKRMMDNSNVLRTNVQFRRDSVSNVSIDEEMTNMIKFQHAYNAAARMITLTDEMLDRIINGMGVSGR
ncbi:flagellar hook-associated protein FlgK [Anaerobacillus sp. MEB173]|uniref:flagellar hook-associated protein FlgK n=1 Tax=Anaerobacillus sp. MEB173 TaxID=3383345 RepID=UPI003F9077C9